MERSRVHKKEKRWDKQRELLLGDFMPRSIFQPPSPKAGRNNGHKKSRRYFIEELKIRDRGFKEIYEMHDRELEAGLEDLEKFLNDKYGEAYKFTLKVERLFE